MACKYVDKFIGLYDFLRKIPFFCCFERVFFISTYIDVNNKKIFQSNTSGNVSSITIPKKLANITLKNMFLIVFTIMNPIAID
jgi:hypothetical protein